MIAQNFTGWKIMKDYEKNILIRDKNKQKDVWVWNNMIITNSILEWTLSLNPSSTWNHLSWNKKKKKHLLIIPFYLKMSQIMEVNYIVKQI